MSVESNVTSFFDWLKKLAPLSQPIRSQTKPIVSCLRFPALDANYLYFLQFLIDSFCFLFLLWLVRDIYLVLRHSFETRSNAVVCVSSWHLVQLIRVQDANPAQPSDLSWSGPRTSTLSHSTANLPPIEFCLGWLIWKCQFFSIIGTGKLNEYWLLYNVNQLKIKYNCINVVFLTQRIQRITQISLHSLFDNRIFSSTQATKLSYSVLHKFSHLFYLPAVQNWV